MPSKFRSEYGRHIDLIERAVESGALQVPLKPKAFVEWAKKKNLPIHPELLNAWPYKKSVELDELEKKYAEALQEIQNLKSIIANDDFDNERYLKKRSVYAMIIGIAISKFRHTTVGNSVATAQIHNVQKEYKIPVSLGTIKKTLDQAFDLTKQWSDLEGELKRRASNRTV